MKTFGVFLAASASALAFGQAGHYRPYSVSSDFHEVANAKQFEKWVGLKPQHLALLQKNLFVVCPRGDEQLFWVYGTNDYRNLPSLVTVDSVLQLYHVFFDATLRRVEDQYLSVKLSRMSEKLLQASRDQASKAPDRASRVAAERNVAFFTVAAELSKPGSAPANEAADAELKRIAAASGFLPSAIFPYKVDYSRFIVRGHYTKTETLKRYFKAMTWYGLMPFELADRAGNPQETQIRMAVLAAEALRASGEEPDWNAIYEPTALYVGTSNTYTPQEVRQAALDAFGSVTAVRPDKLRAFVDDLQSMRTIRIAPNLKRAGTPAGEVQFRFMGLRYIPDSEILQRLTGDPRPMPSGLDVMAVLGSQRAASILDANPSAYNPLGWRGYLPARDKLRIEFSRVPNSTWTSNLYWGWFDVLRLLVRPSPEGYPEFMRSKAWEDKTLSTALASWTELRHDTILYGEQSVAEEGDGDEVPPYVKGFVEPQVAVYDRLLALSKQSSRSLQKLGLIDKRAVEEFASFDDLLSFLASASRKELSGTPLTKKEHLRIRHIEGELDDMNQTMLKYGGNFKALTEDDLNMALVADVHTGGHDALEEGVGKSDDLIAIVPIDGKLYFARGPEFSYYEFTKPISERMTDEAWKASLKDGKDHPRPFWTKSYFTTVKAEDKN